MPKLTRSDLHALEGASSEHHHVHSHDHHHHHEPMDEGDYAGDTREEVDRMRRNILVGMGMLPLAGMVLNPTKPAWAVSNEVSMREDGRYRYINSNAIPDHATGSFPNSKNPNSIKAQSLEFRLPLNPAKAGRFSSIDHMSFGVAVNGVPFDPYTAEFWQRDRQSGWRYEAISPTVDLGLDQNNAHVQPDGTYHYHGLPKGLIKSWSPDQHSIRIGFAADGFPIYAMFGYSNPNDPASSVVAVRSSWRVKSGTRPNGPGGTYDGTYGEDFEYVQGLGDLDEANGRETVTPEYPNGTYAYFVTESFPFIPRLLAGMPDRSFAKGQGGMGPGGTGGGPGAGLGGDRRGPPPGGGFPGQRPKFGPPPR
ncbi:YHYH protein [Thalassospira sp. HJ]|uniref:YHYH protein n=1 Tax=Thalassospira sp. HJ TaxID=1616823 RepID=UPI001269E016|nr:YHYH protein [Thalassospira sp. HJ]